MPFARTKPRIACNKIGRIAEIVNIEKLDETNDM
mgnify:CR=1